MRHLKRLISVLLVLLLTLALVPAAHVRADDTRQLPPGAVTLPRDGELVVRIDGGYVDEHTETVDGVNCLRVDLYVDGTTNDRKLSSMSFKLVYDPDQLTYVKYTGISGSMTAVNPYTAGVFQYAYTSTSGTLMNGKPLVTLYFKMADGLPSGTQITFGFSERVKSSCLDSSNASRNCTVGVQLKPFGIGTIWGDANCDCEVTTADAALVMRSLVGLATLSSRGLKNAKVSGGTALCTEDGALILRRIVGLIAVFPVEG